ncbi:MAG: restriction endonuclease subunit S [Lutibacter sp.]
MKSNYRKIGDFISQVNIKNDKGVENLLGVNLDKKFINSVANLNGVDLSKYKLIRKGQFGCKLMSVGRDKALPISRLENVNEAIISSAYFVFEVKDESILNPEYLMMWFRRPESDRYLWFQSGGDIRGRITWKEFCSLPIKVPSIVKQNEIVKEYNTVINRIKLNEELNQKLEETAQALYKHWFVDYEFPYDFAQGKPNEQGKPYKSSGGKLVYNEELDKEIPEGWEAGVIGDLFTLQRGHDLPTQNRVQGGFPIFASTGIADYHNEYKIDKPTIVTGRSGSLGELFYYDKPCWPLNTTLYAKEFKKGTPLFSMYFLQTINLKEMGAGSAVPTLNRNDIHALAKEIPEEKLMKLFEEKVLIFNSNRKVNEQHIKKLTELKDLLLSKMTKVEREKELVK